MTKWSFFVNRQIHSGISLSPQQGSRFYFHFITNESLRSGQGHLLPRQQKGPVYWLVARGNQTAIIRIIYSHWFGHYCCFMRQLYSQGYCYGSTIRPLQWIGCICLYGRTVVKSVTHREPYRAFQWILCRWTVPKEQPPPPYSRSGGLQN